MKRLSDRFLRRLLVAVLVLVVVDRFVPSFLADAERNRYESDQLFRFENSDLFSLGPLVSYLREHPRGTRPRVAFFGDSIIWGYFVRPGETVPAQFQRHSPHVRVFNFGINGFQTGSAHLIAKTIIGSIDTAYVLYMRNGADSMLGSLIPVDEQDIATYRLTRPDHTERRLQQALGFWHLYTDAYRLQSALFGTSTRQQFYLHKRDLFARILGRETGEGLKPAETPDPDRALRHLTVDVGRADTPPSEQEAAELKGTYWMHWKFANLATMHKKRIVFIELVNHSDSMPDKVRLAFNAMLAPYVTFVRVAVPGTLTVDGQHLSPVGSLAFAQMLLRDAPPLVTDEP